MARELKAMPGRLGAVPWSEVFAYSELVDDFMLRVFDADPTEFMITDDSRLLDFVGVDGDVADVYSKISAIYGIDASAVPQGSILGIVSLIARTR